VRLNRPTSLNAITRALIDELTAVLDRLERTAGARVVILTGVGRGFCSGHDLAELDEVTASTDARAVMDNQVAYSGLIKRINSLTLPVIAAVNGPAAGGGLAIALAADTRVCEVSARFNVAPVRLGISGADVGISYLLPRIVGPTLAFEMMLTGRLVGAEEALRNGLVLRVASDGAVVDAALEIADAICANGPYGVQETKRMMWAGLDAPTLGHAIDAEDRAQIVCVLAGDARRALPAHRRGRRIAWNAAT
jgi:enoyl-CoA hydratase